MGGGRSDAPHGIGSRVGDRVLCPPVEYDPDTGAAVDVDLVEVGPGGVVTSWTWVAEPGRKHPFDHPFAFALIRLIPGDPIQLLAGERGLDPERHARLMAEYGLDKPLWEQYLIYLGGVVQGDLGKSIVTKRPVLGEFVALFPATVELSVPVTECTIVDAAGRRLVEAGEFELLVGPSSREEVLLSATFRVAGAETGRIASDREALERR